LTAVNAPKSFRTRLEVRRRAVPAEIKEEAPVRSASQVTFREERERVACDMPAEYSNCSNAQEVPVES
jgi:hypothetical protein